MTPKEEPTMEEQDRGALLALAERVEAAMGPDRELDFYIWAAIEGVTNITEPSEGHPMTPGRGGRVEGIGPDGLIHLYGFVDPGQLQRNWMPYGGEDRYPTFTASLDAAMTLVPEGWDWSAGTQGNGKRGHSFLLYRQEGARETVIDPDAATPALALTAAALRARAASPTPQSGEGQ